MKSSYLEECCKVLEAKMEYKTDELLVRLIGIQQLAQTISVTLAVGNPNLQQLPLMMVVQSFQQQLDGFRASLSPLMRTNSWYLHHHGVEDD